MKNLYKAGSIGIFFLFTLIVFAFFLFTSLTEGGIGSYVTTAVLFVIAAALFLAVKKKFDKEKEDKNKE